MKFIAHYNQVTGEQQLLKDHLLETAALSKRFGEKLNLETVCYLAGLLHDLGKYSDKFQNYLKQAMSDPNSVTRGSVDHSTAGGKLLYEYLHQKNQCPYQKLVAELVGNAIISHHSSHGLQDFIKPEEDFSLDYLKRVRDKELPEYGTIKKRFFEDCLSESEFLAYLEMATEELKAFFISENKPTENQLFFIAKMIYSCLLDADRTNTMNFETRTTYEPIQQKPLFLKYSQRLEQKLKTFEEGNPTPINQLRNQMSKRCLDFAKEPTGIYGLAIPTGGGKTLASLRFALEHTRIHEKERIIYVTPFTTIIEQNAQVVRDILKEDRYILEHHSNILQEEIVDQKNKQNQGGLEERREREEVSMKDNWEAPIIFTTMVQFLDVIYSRGTRNPRRFHQLHHAVIIFDEVQGLPVHCTYLFNEAINYLKNFAQTTSILCTATQPALDNLDKKLQKDKDILEKSELQKIEAAFERVEIIDKTTQSAWNIKDTVSLIEEILQERNNLLVILNTKKAVLKLYQLLAEQSSEEIELYHLSTAMCPAHRKQILKEINVKLNAKNQQRKLVCITTQLIEAGIDISFEAVIRSSAGLDSIAQAAGRCNRNGEQPNKQPVYIIRLEKKLEDLKYLKEIKAGKEITLKMLENLRMDSNLYSGKLLSFEAQNTYFKQFYKHSDIEPNLKYPAAKNSLELFSLLGKNENTIYQYKNKYGKEQFPDLLLHNSTKTIGKYFNVIDTPTTAVLVPYEEGKDIIQRLNGDELALNELGPLLKKAQQYIVNLFSYEIEDLQKNGYIRPLYHGEIFALCERAYSNVFGIDKTGSVANQTIVL